MMDDVVGSAKEVKLYSPVARMVTMVCLLAYLSLLERAAGLSAWSTNKNIDPTTVTWQSKYQYARTVRVVEGHDAAVEYYQQILRENPTDVTASSHIAARPDTPRIQDQILEGVSRNHISLLRNLFQEVNFTTTAIADLVLSKETSEALFSVSPLFLNPLPAGAKAPPLPTCKLSCMIQLFLLSVSIPMHVWMQLFSAQELDLMTSLSIVAVDQERQLIVPYCHVMPVELPNKSPLFVMTDLHPRVLSTIHTGSSGETGAVMYIGPDSVSLVQHFCMHLSTRDSIHSIVDFGAGSGIQALSTAVCSLCDEVTLVDINPRALKFSRFNFLLNGLSEPRMLLGDLRNPHGQQWFQSKRPGEHVDSSLKPWDVLLPRKTDLILSNPPFLPIPESDAVIKKRYGLFSGGGKSGEEILRMVVSLASTLLNEKGMVAIVSEFMNPDSVPGRVKGWWSKDSFGSGLLFTNEFPIDDITYSERRADSEKEIEVWMKHLEIEGIQRISPGLLFIRKDSNENSLNIRHEKVPKTAQGSIWTPANRLAVGFTRNIFSNEFTSS